MRGHDGDMFDYEAYTPDDVRPRFIAYRVDITVDSDIAHASLIGALTTSEQNLFSWRDDNGYHVVGQVSSYAQQKYLHHELTHYLSELLSYKRSE